MSTFEATVSMLKPLSDEQLLFIQDLAQRFMRKEANVDLYKSMTEDELLEALSVAREHAAQGKVIDATESSKLIREKYGL